MGLIRKSTFKNRHISDKIKLILVFANIVIQIGWSEAGKVIVVDYHLCFGLGSLFLCIRLRSSLFFGFLGGRLRIEAKILKILVQTCSVAWLFNSILRVSLTLFFVFLGLQNCQLFFFDPIGFNVVFFDRTFLFVGAIKIDSFASVILLKSLCLWLLWLRLFLWLFFSSFFFVALFNFFRLVLTVFICVEIVLKVSEVSLSSSSFSGAVAILTSSYTLPVPLCLSWKCPSPNFLVRGVGGCLVFLICLASSLMCSGYCSVRTG